MDEAGARALVARFLVTVPRPSKKERWVVSHVADHGDFWLVSWTTSRIVVRRPRLIAMTGNYPVGVRKSDGVAGFYTGLYPLAEFAERLRSLRESAPELREATAGAAPDAEPGAAADGGGM